MVAEWCTAKLARRCALVVLVVVVMGCSQADEGASDPAEQLGDVEDGDVSIDYITTPSGEPVSGGRLSFGLDAETDGWDVTASRWAGSAYTVGNAIYDPLMAYDEQYRPAPYLAESVESNADFTEWRINLRPGVTFHDATPVDAEAVAANLVAHRTGALTAPAVTFIAAEETGDDETPLEVKVSTDGDLTVVVEMELPWSTFPDTLTSQIGYVMAPSMMEDPDGTRQPVGSGPFEFDSWSPGERLVVTRNASYWREGLPYLDAVEFRVLTDTNSRARAFGSGDISAFRTEDARQLIEFADQAAQGRAQMFTDDNIETLETVIALNVSQPPFDRPLAREAIAYAVDREALSIAAYEGLFAPAYGPSREGSPWYVETDVPRYDPDRARSLVEQYEAEYGEPLRFTVNIIPEPDIQLIAQTLEQQARAVGIEAQLSAIDQTQLILDALSGNYQATGFILFGSSLLDREYVFIADNPPGSPLNFTRNSNDTIIEAMNAARATDDEDEWFEYFATVQRELAKDLNFIFLVHNVRAVVFATEVHGLADPTLPDGSRAGRILTPFVTEVWVDR